MQNILRQMSENINQPMVVTDAHGQVLWVNKLFQNMCGHSTDQLQGKKPGHVLQGPDTSSETVRKIAEAIAAGRPFHGTILNYHADSHSYWVELDITPIRDVTDTVLFFVAIEREVHSPDNEIARVCMFCKSFHDGETMQWVRVEEYLSHRFGLAMSHGVCPKCTHKFFED